MSCSNAEKFLSALYDGEPVPEEVNRHVAGCPSCQAEMRKFGAISSEMRSLAEAETQSLPPLTQPRVTAAERRHWWNALTRPMRVPRIAALTFTALLALISVGWLRAVAKPRTEAMFHLDTKIERAYGRSVSTDSSSSNLRVGKPDVSYAMINNKGLGSMIEVTSIRDRAVELSVRFKQFHGRMDSDQLEREMKKVPAQKITYVPGQQVSLPVEGGGSVQLSGSVVREEEGRIVSVKQESLLPAIDEISLGMPVLIRDGTEVVAKQSSAGAEMHCPDENDHKCGIALYSPGTGLFFFSIHPVPGAIVGTAGMSAAQFTEDGRSYTLYSSTPITGGDQPRSIWIVHHKDYLPSQHGRAKSDDTLDSLIGGDVSN